MWTFTDDLTVLANLIVRSHMNEGVLKYYQIYPVDGYVLRIPNLDEYQKDENGNYVYDANGDRVLMSVCRSYGGATVAPDYDWTTNPDKYYAEPYEEGMTVV